MAESAFQVDAFQNNAFQIAGVVPPLPIPPTAGIRGPRPLPRPPERPNDDDEVLAIILAAIPAITERRH